MTNEIPLAVSFVETTQVTEGVSCDIYRFLDDETRDLGVVTVQKNYKTPRQRVLLGDQTIEGFMSGEGTLTVGAAENDIKTYHFPSTSNEEVAVKVGQTMQWHADGDTELVFYEICEPPYEDGRFENLPE
jgi:mannose-6-phosphate isomerase-like protein (cupin superfamily)